MIITLPDSGHRKAPKEKHMTELVAKTIYYRQTGQVDTERTLELARARAEALGLRTFLVASTSGETGVRAVRALQGFDLIVVSHATGFRGPDTQELTPKNRAIIEAGGVRILTCQHAFGGVNRAVRNKLGTYQLDEIIAYTLRLFGEGIKVVAEMALMAADAGLVRTDTPVMGIAGTGSGADTAAVLLPTHAQTFFDLKIVEIVCRPAPEHPAFR
jgi:hypothetical protein